MDHQIARREAESLGLTDTTAWTAATHYIERTDALARRSSPTSAAEPVRFSRLDSTVLRRIRNRPATQDKASGDQARAYKPQGQSKSPLPRPLRFPPCNSQPVTVIARTGQRRTRSIPPLCQLRLVPSAWRPFAAMVITGLAVPLAYWSRTLTPVLLSKARASLPGPAHRPKSLPVESGA